MEEKAENGSKRRKLGFWKWAMASVIFSLILCYFSQNLKLSSRPEVSTPLTSLRRLAEGCWLKQQSVSPYSGSMYLGSPLLLFVLGPFTTKNLVSVVADVINAFFIHSTGRRLETAHRNKLKLLGFEKLFAGREVLPSREIAALVYLWNPFTILSCIGFSTAPVENLFVILCLYGTSAGFVSLAAFGWVVATHLSLYPFILVMPVVFLLGYGVDAPSRIFFSQSHFQVGDERRKDHNDQKSATPTETEIFCWRQVILFFFWASIWMSYLLTLCAISMKGYGGLGEMFKRTYGFILAV